MKPNRKCFSNTVYCVLCTVYCVLISCNTKSIISAEDMKSIMWDMLRADEYVPHIKDSTLSQKDKAAGLYEQVFAVHNTDKEKFYTSLKYYISHPDLYKTLNDSVKAYGGRVVEVEKKRLEALQAIENMKLPPPYYYIGDRYETVRDTILLNDKRWDFKK